MSPDFSIITPTFRRPVLLRRAINSVKNQTFRNYEHIIIDDANDGNTGKIIDEFSDERIIFKQHDSRKGAAGAYNTGMKMANGRFIMFLDDDDEYMPTILEDISNIFFKADLNVGFLWTGIIMVLDTDERETNLYTRIWPSNFKSIEEKLIMATTIGNGYGLCIRRECVNEIGTYDESFTMGHDADFMFRLVSLFDFITIPKALVKIHQHDLSQLTGINNDPERLEMRKRILIKHENLLNKYRGLHNVHYKHVAELYYSIGKSIEGRRIMLNIISKRPFYSRFLLDFLLLETSGRNASSIYWSKGFMKLRSFFRASLINRK